MRKIIKAMRDGYQFYYLPDMDFGPKESILSRFGVSGGDDTCCLAWFE